MYRLLGMLMTSEHAADFGYWLVFFAGQCLYILKRSGSAIRSKTNPIKSRRAFVAVNWDILTVRMTVGEFWIYWMWRHVSIPQVAALFSVPVPAWLPQGVSSSWVAALALGYMADGLLDWLGQWSKTPDFIKEFIKERVPDLPAQNGG